MKKIIIILLLMAACTPMIEQNNLEINITDVPDCIDFNRVRWYANNYSMNQSGSYEYSHDNENRRIEIKVKAINPVSEFWVEVRCNKTIAYNYWANRTHNFSNTSMEWFFN